MRIRIYEMFLQMFPLSGRDTDNIADRARVTEVFCPQGAHVPKLGENPKVKSGLNLVVGLH